MAANSSAVPVSGNGPLHPEIPELPALAIPSQLRAHPQWVCWRYEDRDGKRTKAPICAKVNGATRYAKSNDPTTWTDFETAVQAAAAHGLDGIGFCFAPDDGLTGLDLDHVLNPETGELKPEAADILARFAGTYAEVSPSGTGLRLFCYGTPRRSGKNTGRVKWLEVYAHPSSRYLTVTGNAWSGSAAAVTEQQAALDWLHERFMQKEESTGYLSVESQPAPADPPDLDDAALLDKARAARNGSEFAALWSGDTSGQGGDHSAADLALCNRLAFYTGNDSARIDRLFRQSGLMRPKWDQPHFSDGQTYGQVTIAKALEGNRETYSGKRQHADYRPEAGAAGADALVDDAKLARLFQTDLGNSERLVARHGRDLLYCFDFGKWLCWDGIRWALDRDGAAMGKAKDTARKMLNEAAALADKEDARKLATWSFRSQARERLAALLFLAQSDVSVRPERLDTHPWLLNVANGTLDLQTGTLRPANRADLLTKAAPVVYDPAATCPEWLAFLNRIFDGNKEIIRYVQKAVGYSLTGDDREQAFFVCHGVGRNGKSTLLETIAALLGEDYAQQAAPELLMQKTHDRHPTELAALRGMRLVTAIETGEGRRLNEPLIKQLTGGDRIAARFMHGDFFTFTPTHKLWLATNHKPTIRGTDVGIWRRIKLIPFTVQIPDEEKDEGLKARLRAPEARPGILNWALEGVLLWQQEGLKPPQAVVEATQAYREEMDVLAAWLADCCVVTKLAEAKAADLYKSYSDWRDSQGERPESQRSFGLRLTERGLDQIRRRNGIFWLGIGLLAREPCEPCEPVSGIKDTNSGEHIYNPENRFTSFTSFTPPPAAGISSHHSDGSKPVDSKNSANSAHSGEQKPPSGDVDEEEIVRRMDGKYVAESGNSGNTGNTGNTGNSGNSHIKSTGVAGCLSGNSSGNSENSNQGVDKNKELSIPAVAVATVATVATFTGDPSVENHANCGNSANSANSGERKPAVVATADVLPSGATSDARELWGILKHVRGIEVAARLAAKLGWNESRVIAAAMELRRYGRASVNGSHVGLLSDDRETF